MDQGKEDLIQNLIIQSRNSNQSGSEALEVLRDLQEELQIKICNQKCLKHGSIGIMPLHSNICNSRSGKNHLSYSMINLFEGAFPFLLFNVERKSSSGIHSNIFSRILYRISYSRI